MFILKALLMMLLPCYRVDFPVDAMPKEFTYKDSKDGKLKTFKDGGDAYMSLKRLFVDEKSGWQYDISTYIPDRIIDSPDMRINCMDGGIVVNYRFEGGGNDFTQISKLIVGSCSSVRLELGSER